MDNALIADGVLAAVLLLGALIGAKRGLFKSLMGLLTVVLALVGAVVLADMLTPRAVELVYPVARDHAARFFSEALGELAERLGRFGLSAADVNPYLSTASMAEQAAALLINGVVHAVLLLALYIALLVVLKLLTRLLDRVFDLPVLSAVNGLGGALLGFAEAAVLLHVALYLGTRLGVSPLAGFAENARLPAFFLNHSPVELISSFTQKA